MNKKIYSSLIALVLMLCGLGGWATLAQKARGRTPAQAKRVRESAPVKPSILSALPASDAVMLIDLQRLLRDAMPRVLDQAKLAQANAEIEKFKTRTGIDPRSFDHLAVGMRFNSLPSGMTKVNSVALAHGSFNAGAMVAAGRLATNGKYTEEKYNGATIYVFDLNEQVKMFGLLNMKVNRLGVSALDDHTLAIGDPAIVRAAIDAHRGGGRVGSELVQLATRNPNALVGFGANLPQYLTQGLSVPNDEIARNLASVRQVYGSVGETDGGFDSLLIARTENADQAKGLSDTIYALKQFAPLISGRLSGAKAKLAENALESLKVTAQGNELQIRLALAQTDLNTLMGGQ
ncbi:MAG TPA: hypothetical protein VGO91_00230 [Pyrinomonadaceae bacterium]|nr:hypothetical protein [Pyrinomonadaceae bacterium]